MRKVLSACRRLSRNALVASTCLVLISCVRPLRNDGPAIDESRAGDIVAVIEVLSTRYFERNGCFGFLIESEDGSGNLKLVHLLIDGEMIEMQNEQEADVGVDVEGELFIPAYPSEIAWLPCGTNSPANRFAGQVADLASSSEFYASDGERRYPRYGIPVESLARFLQKKRPQGEGFRCD
jgi:hypothetical protein